MKKILFILLLLIIFVVSISPTTATTYLPNSNISGEDYFNTTVDNLYYLNNSDSLTQIDLKYEINNYPQKIVYTFKNSNNETLTLINTISKENIFPIGFKIIENYKAYYNLKPLNLTGVFILGKIPQNYNITYTYLLSFDKFKGKSSIKFDDNKIFCCGSQSFNYDKRINFFIDKFSLSSQTSFLTYTEIRLNYVEKIIAINKYKIESTFDSFNFVFKFIFLIGKGTIGIANFIGVISDTDFLNYQLAVLLPLEILNLILNTIFMILGFIIKMGILFFLGMIILLSFIFSVITTNNIMDAIPKFAHTTIYILTLLIINPSKWIFEKIVKFWS